jgi:hypothetical protein
MAQYHGVILIAKVNSADAAALAPALHAVIDTNLRNTQPNKRRRLSSD